MTTPKPIPVAARALYGALLALPLLGACTQTGENERAEVAAQRLADSHAEACASSAALARDLPVEQVEVVQVLSTEDGAVVEIDVAGARALCSLSSDFEILDVSFPG